MGATDAGTITGTEDIPPDSGAPGSEGEDSRSNLQEWTLKRIAERMRSQETACVVQVVELIKAVTLGADSLSVHQLADIIGRDLTTMGRLLKVACSVGYNPEGVEITTLSQAIQLVGYDRVRSIAVSLLLLQDADRRWSDDDFEDTLGAMLTGALLAEALMAGRRSHDPAHSFLCAALRSYGRLVLVSFMPDEFREARHLAAVMGETAAFGDIFGTEPVELGHCLLEQAGLSKPLLAHLRPARSGEAPPTPDEHHHLLLDFASGFAELLVDSGSQAEFDQGYAEKLARIGGQIGCTREALPKLLEGVIARMEGYRRSVNSPIYAGRVVQNIRNLLTKDAFVPRPPLRRVPTVASGGAEFVCGRNAEMLLRPGLKELSRVLSFQPPDPGAAWSLATRLIWRGLELENSVVFLRNPETGRFVAEYGFGSGLGGIRGAGQIDPAEKTIFSVSLATGRDVILQRPHDPAIAPFVPAWLKPVATGALALLPVTDGAGTFALLLGIAPARHACVLSPRTMELLQDLRRKLGEMRRSKS